MKNNAERIFSIKDLNIASLFLASRQLTLLRLERINERAFLFVFADPNSQAQAIIRDHLNGQFQITSLDLFEAIKTLKTRIHLGI